MHTPRNQDTRESLLEHRQNEDPLDNVSCCTGVTIILSVLTICGVLAILISILGIFYRGEQNIDFLQYATNEDQIYADLRTNPSETTSAIPSKTTTSALITSDDQLLLQKTSKEVSPCEKRIVGFYTEFESMDITKHQLSKLTHVVFAYIEMAWDGKLQFKSDKSKNRFLRLNSKAKSAQSDVKVMVGIGGFGNSQHFASVVGNSEKMKDFIGNVVAFLEEYNIDGVDFYWRSANEEDKWRYITFVRELRKSLTIRNREKSFLISLTIPAVISSYELAYDLEEFLEDVDFFNVFSMDYYGPWENQWGAPAGPIAPLYNTVAGKNYYCVDSTLNYYVCKTKQPSKFNIVIPFFARLWNHVKEAVEPEKEVIRNVELKNNKAVGDGYMFRWTVEDKKYNISPATWDEESKSSYIYDPVNETYLTFEDEKSINAKIEYVNLMNLGGVWLWTLNMDDDNSNVLNMVFSEELCSNKTQSYVKYQC